jgi:general secretion pathway protein B
MVIVNDRLLREGDEIAPGVKLEQIVNDSLILNYKGYRFKR